MAITNGQKDFIAGSRETIQQLRGYLNGQQPLSLKEFDKLLRRGEVQLNRLESILFDNKQTRTQLRSVKNELKSVLSNGSLKTGDLDDAITFDPYAAGSPGLFTSSLHETVHESDEIPGIDFNFQ